MSPMTATTEEETAGREDGSDLCLLKEAVDTGPLGLTYRLELLARVLRSDAALAAVDRESLAYDLEADVRRLRRAVRRAGKAS